MNWKKTTIIMLLLAGCAGAVKVGVYVEFPDGTDYTKCVEADDQDDGYKVMQAAGLDINWSTSDLWGHGMCGIEDTGCPADDCWCSSNYWGFLLGGESVSSYTYMPVGFDAPGECWNHDPASYVGHYCATHGDVLAFRWGGWGDMPRYVKFGEICQNRKRSENERKQIEVKGLAEEADEVSFAAGAEVKLKLVDSRDGSGLDDALVEVYERGLGVGPKLCEAGADEDGNIILPLTEPGTYHARVSSKNAPRRRLTIKVSEPPVTSSTVEATTSIEATSTVEETTSLEETTTLEETSTIEETTTLKASTSIEKESNAEDAALESVTGEVVAQPKTGSSRILAIALMAGLVFGLYLARKK